MKKRSKLTKVILGIIVVIILLFLLAPIIAVIGGSFSDTEYFAFPPEGFSLKWYSEAFGNKEHLGSLRISLMVSLFATVLASGLAIPACLALVKGNPRITSKLSKLFMAPIILPVIVWALGMLQWMGILKMQGSSILLVLAHTILITPYLIRVVGASMSEFNFSLEDAAISLGATPIKAFFKVTLPIILPGVIVGAIFGFMISFSEVIVTLFVSGSSFTTFPVRVYSAMRTEGLDPMVLAYSAIIIVVVLIISSIGEKVARWSRFF